ncbi:MAG: DUF484 family protein [Betaproteobacteria bacterium]|nr:MAG: DUF484 family protein [Betaproteobacteria bacterium]
MNAEDVVRYLQDNPGFFEDYAEVLAQIYIPHPHGGRAIPIAERQILTLRERSKKLEGKLAELIQFGEDNDAIGEKMHRLCLALISAGDMQGMLQALYYNLREDFAVPHAAVRIWGPDAGDLARPECAPVTQELRQYTAGLEHPYCGAGANAEVASWFGEAAAQLRSFACVPLRDGRNACAGMLALASEDLMRFYPEMGTLYLKRLGELASAALQRYW